ncbi:hypothetical protein NPIL_14581, partial [Nephila pilipes]
KQRYKRKFKEWEGIKSKEKKERLFSRKDVGSEIKVARPMASMNQG